MLLDSHRYLWLSMLASLLFVPCVRADEGDEVVVWDNSFNAAGPPAGFTNFAQDFENPPDVIAMVAADVDLPFGEIVTGGRLRFFFSNAGSVPDGIIFLVWEEREGRLVDEPVARFDVTDDFRVYRDGMSLVIEGTFDGGQSYISTGQKRWWTILPIREFPPSIFARTTTNVVGEGIWASDLDFDPAKPWSHDDAELVDDHDVMFQLLGQSGPADGDVDSDGDVDLFDAAFYFACIRGLHSGPLSLACAEFDFDADDDVDLIDFGSLQTRFTRTCGFEILHQPVGVTACPHDAFDLHVEVDLAPVEYQWRRDGMPIPGETTDTLLFPDVGETDTGTYNCVVSDSCGNMAMTVPVTVNVLEDVVILIPPVGGTICAGSDINISVVADAVNGYQWFRNGKSIDGATEASLAVIDVDENDAGFYQVLVTGDCGLLLSPSAEVQVVDCP